MKDISKTVNSYYSDYEKGKWKVLAIAFGMLAGVVGVPLIVWQTVTNQAIKVEKQALNNLEKLVLNDIELKDSSIKDIDIRGVDILSGVEEGLISLQGLATYSSDNQKFINLNYEVDNKVTNNLSVNYENKNATDFLKELASVIEKESLKDFIVTQAKVDEKLVEGIVFHNGEKQTYEVDGKKVYYGHENLKDFQSVPRPWYIQPDKRTESTLIYVGTPVIDEEKNNIYFETEVLIQQYKLEHGPEGGVNRYKELSVVKKDKIYLELTEELRNNPNLVYKKFKDYHSAKQTDKYSMKNDELKRNHINYKHTVQLAVEDKEM